MKYTQEQIIDFIIESNAIEKVYTERAVHDSKLAWLYLSDKEPLSLHDILTAHLLILRRLDPKIAGKLRGELGINVSVGGRDCPKFWQVGSRICDWLRHINEKRIPQWSEDDIRRFHISFEHIHPFVDGNGRTGRLIYCWMREKMGYPIHIIYESQKGDYYQWFRQK